MLPSTKDRVRIDEERMALKALRGDFAEVPAGAKGATRAMEAARS